MKVLILGGTGMLGHKLTQVFSPRFDTTATVRSVTHLPPAFQIGSARVVTLDVQDEAALHSVVEQVRPDVVVNAVGVVKQVAHDPIQAIALNSLLPHRLALICSQLRARLIHISTDCVFSGQRGMYSESDVPDAKDLYGRSKLLGEVVGPACLTLRTSIIGREIRSANGLVEWFLSKKGGKVTGFSRAVFSGFPTVTLAHLLADIVQDHQHLEGLFHLSAEPIDKYRLLVLIRDAFQVDVEIEPVSHPVVDRSLDSTALRTLVGYRPPAWPDLVAALKDDASGYPYRRAA